MIWLIAGVLVLAGLLFLLNRIEKAESAALARKLRVAGAIICGAAGAGLLLTGRVGIAVVLFGFAATLLGFQGVSLPGLFGRMGGNGNRNSRAGGPPPKGAMSRDEALEVLGLEGRPSEEEIKGAHRRLMAKVHPDHEGSTYLASKINQAKDVLLGK
ncbi:DnaJ domain-containing protein [Tepidicaulis sp. LMO-SS28]|uniref:DnaJ domain-containing protein n=1 Tax=Tepidicaulis sp. LMO-SS28 TaxID=3447455 RepID=UPI003EDED66E